MKMILPTLMLYAVVMLVTVYMGTEIGNIVSELFLRIADSFPH